MTKTSASPRRDSAYQRDPSRSVAVRVVALSIATAAVMGLVVAMAIAAHLNLSQRDSIALGVLLVLVGAIVGDAAAERLDIVRAQGWPDTPD